MESSGKILINIQLPADEAKSKEVVVLFPWEWTPGRQTHALGEGKLILCFASQDKILHPQPGSIIMKNLDPGTSKGGAVNIKIHYT